MRSARRSFPLRRYRQPTEAEAAEAGGRSKMNGSVTMLTFGGRAEHIKG